MLCGNFWLRHVKADGNYVGSAGHKDTPSSYSCVSRWKAFPQLRTDTDMLHNVEAALLRHIASAVYLQTCACPLTMLPLASPGPGRCGRGLLAPSVYPHKTNIV